MHFSAIATGILVLTVSLKSSAIPTDARELFLLRTLGAKLSDKVTKDQYAWSISFGKLSLMSGIIYPFWRLGSSASLCLISHFVELGFEPLMLYLSITFLTIVLGLAQGRKIIKSNLQWRS